MARWVPMDWVESNRLIAEQGSEFYLGMRITAERQARQWSQAELARQMREIGCSIPQTAISKIESGDSRRDITVDEAIAFARVFDIPFAELVMPPFEVELIAQLSLSDDAISARSTYDHAVNKLAMAAKQDAKFLSVLRAFASNDLAVPLPPAYASLAKRRTEMRPVAQDVERALSLMTPHPPRSGRDRA